MKAKKYFEAMAFLEAEIKGLEICNNVMKTQLNETNCKDYGAIQLEIGIMTQRIRDHKKIYDKFLTAN